MNLDEPKEDINHKLEDISYELKKSTNINKDDKINLGSLEDVFNNLDINVVRLLNSKKIFDEFNYTVYRNNKHLGFKILLSEVTCKKLIKYMINLFLEKENILIKYKDVEYNLSKDFIELPQENILKSGEIKNVFIKVIKNYRNGFISVLLSDINYETKHIISVDDVKPEPTKDFIYMDDYNKYKYLNVFEKSIYLLNNDFPITKKGFPTVQKVIFNVFENNNKYCDYFYNWLAAIVQNPGDKKTNIAMILTGKNNTGKGTVLRILRFIFNINYLQEDENSFKKEFNEQMFLGKFMVGFDEFFTTPSKVNLIKSYISEDTVSIEGKGKGRTQVNNYTRFCITANTHKTLIVPIPITDGETDRRLAYFYSNKFIIPNSENEEFDINIHAMTRQELVVDFLEHKKNFKEECINFVVFLHNYKVDDPLLRSIPPESRGRQEALLNSKTKNAEVVEDKIISFFQNPYKYGDFLQFYDKEKIYIISTSYIYDRLSDYERKGNLSSIQKFNKYLEKLNFEFAKSKNNNKYIKVNGKDKAVYLSKLPIIILKEVSDMGYRVDFADRTILDNIMFDDDDNDSEKSLVKDEYSLDDLNRYNINIKDIKPYIKVGVISEYRSNMFKIIDKDQFMNLLKKKNSGVDNGKKL